MRKRLYCALALAFSGAALATGVASANHVTGGGHSFTFLQAGFTQDLVGTLPAFIGGVAFAPDGDPWVDQCAFSGSPLDRFDLQSTPPDVNGTPVHSSTEVASNAGCGLTNHPDGFLYSNTSSGVVQINAGTGAATGLVFGAGGNALGIATDPQTGNLVYVGSDSTILTAPVGGSASVFSSVTSGNFVDGIAFDPTGNFLFLSNRSINSLTIVRHDGTLVQNVALGHEPDGIAFHAATPRFVVTDNTDGTMSRVDFAGDDYTAAATVSLFASGGSRGDLSQVGPDGCVYVAQDGTRYNNDVTSADNSVVRICGGFAPPRGVPDTTAPSCVLTAVVAGPPKQLQITAQDGGSGLKSIVVSSATNATVSIPAFTAGTTDPVVVTATKIDQTKSSTVALTVTDRAGNVTKCDPVLTTTIRESGAPATASYTGLAQSESRVTVLNGNPGVKNLEIAVNGAAFKVTGLGDGQTRTLDVSSAMRPGTANTVTVTARGKPGASATVVISD